MTDAKPDALNTKMTHPDQWSLSPVDTKYSGGSVGLPGVPASCWDGKAAKYPQVKVSKSVLAVLYRIRAHGKQVQYKLMQDYAGQIWPGR
ncbi:hypothetical protein PENANT_c002G02046 [Penicillium antarcticum]|uniref:Uncharacterized protein n=1 Tax=Penicillium antarcticum TaxID=416450 RepID=A0A1V6QLW0_9EURO|nr:hypothetical protein PENANT_c002G02046 [Penicillium antarcticum]